MAVHTDIKTSRFLERALEILPGALAWGFMLALIITSLFAPIWAAYLIIGYILFWVTKIAGYSQRLVRGYYRLHIANNVSWRKRLNDLSDPNAALEKFNEDSNLPRLKSESRVRKFYGKYLKQAVQNQKIILNPQEIYHAVVIATYNESIDVLEPTVRAVVESDYDLSQVMLIIAYEERGGEETERNARELIEKYSSEFDEALAIKHPDGIPGEAKAKAGNITYAAKRVAEHASEKAIEPDKIIITTLDADNRPHKNYLAYLTYVYAITKDRTKNSYQPMAMFFNNIWDAPALMRVVAVSNSFWLLMEAMRPHRLRNFSAHAQSLKTLMKTNYWNVKSIVEDGHQYWRTYFTYEGEHSVIPLYTSIYQDAVLADGYLKTMKAQFYQLRRWAWGVSDTPYVIVKSFKMKNIPWSNKGMEIMRQIEGHFSWAVAPIVLAVGGWIPFLVNQGYSDSILAYRLPELSSQVQTLALIGLLAPMVASLLSMPARPERYGIRRSIMMYIQWIFVPVTLIVFGSFAALNAQTRLMLGKYLESFNVTEKKRVQDPDALEEHL